MNLAVSDEKTGDAKYEEFFPLIKRDSIDIRNYVKKAVQIKVGKLISIGE
ncbi:MAG: hypothetical protein L6422_09575 [Candidatus Marinimicrobia bacterium]|nr:hypothetical protein [bacterium]MCG2716505.1 hypothetical protein [Candidatus Neomarinimicrobiota bacterium]